MSNQDYDDSYEAKCASIKNNLPNQIQLRGCENFSRKNYHRNYYNRVSRCFFHSHTKLINIFTSINTFKNIKIKNIKIQDIISLNPRFNYEPNII